LKTRESSCIGRLRIGRLAESFFIYLRLTVHRKTTWHVVAAPEPFWYGRKIRKRRTHGAPGPSPARRHDLKL
jgi:hypothetical protein